MPRNCKCGGRYRNTSGDYYMQVRKIAHFKCDKCGKPARQRLRKGGDRTILTDLLGND